MLYIETLDVIHRHNTNTSARGQAREGQTRHKTHIKQEESGNHHNNGTDLSLWGQQSKVNFTFKHLSSFPLYFFVQNVLTSISTHLPNLLTVSDSLYFFGFQRTMTRDTHPCDQNDREHDADPCPAELACAPLDQRHVRVRAEHESSE